MKKLLFLPVLFFLILVCGAHAQETRSIVGLVLNQLGEPIVAARISLLDAPGQVALSDKHGRFTLTQIPLGQVRISAQHELCHEAVLLLSADNRDRKVQIVMTEKLIGLPEVDVVAYRSRSPFVEASYSAMKMGIPTMQLPGSIEVLTQRKLEEQQALSFTEAMRNVSGLSNASAGEANNVSEVFVSRGFSLANSRNYFRDGMRYRKVANMPLVGVSRIEFVKGPSSVLYGTVEPGGIVNIITTPALHTPRYSATFRLGSYGLKQLSADLTGPVTSNRKVRYRVNGMYEYTDSYRRSVNAQRISLSPKVDVDLSPRTALGLRANYFSDSRVVDPGVVHQGGVVVPNGDRLFVGEPWARSKYHSVDAGYTLKHEITNNWKWHSQFTYTRLTEDRLYFQMKEIKADQMNRRLAKWDAEISYYTLQNDFLGNFSTWGLEHRLLLGVEYEYAHNKRVVSGQAFTPISLTHPVYTDKPTDIDSYKRSTDLVIGQSNWGVYAQDFVALTRHIRLLLGGRWDWTRESNENILKGTETKTKPSAFSPRVALMYNPDETSGLHVSYTTSYVPTSGQTKQGVPFEPIRTLQWEVGGKKSLFNNSTTATLSLYYMRKKNLLTPDLEDPQYRIQIGEHYSRGLEFTINSCISRGLALELSYAYTEGEVRKTNDIKIPVGSKLANVPNHRFNIWGSYTLYDGALRGLSWGGGCFASSKSFGNTANSIVLPAYVTADIFVAYTKQNYKFALNVKNITNQRYYLGAQASNLLTPAAPRSVVFSTSVTL